MGSAITIDATAAGWGWSLTGQGTMDLYTVVVHQLGYALGLDNEADGLTAETLAAGAATSVPAGPTTPTAEALSSPPAAATTWEITLTDGSQLTISLIGGLLGVTVGGVTESRALSSVLELAIVGSDQADAFELGLGVPELTLPIRIDGGGGADRIRGPPSTLTWNITGSDTGTAGSVTLIGIENFEGAAGNEDTFVFGPNGFLAGTVDGGQGGFDTVEIAGNGTAVTSTITGAQSGTIARGTDVITYSGMEPVTITGTTAIVINAPSAATVVLAESGTSPTRPSPSTSAARARHTSSPRRTPSRASRSTSPPAPTT